MKYQANPSVTQVHQTSTVVPLNKIHHDLTYQNQNGNETKLLSILSQLNEEELETAAKTSYNYLQKPHACDRKNHAKDMAKRYLKSKNGDVSLATKKMKATIVFREKIGIDRLRQAFNHEQDPASIDDHYRENLEKRLACGANFVQGYDKDGRATHIFIPRLTNSHDPEWTIRESLYTMERAISCSKAPDHSVNAVIDFQGFQLSKHAPPIDIGKEFLLTLRHHYAGQVNKIFILDAPMGFYMLWNILKPFIGKATQSKIEFVSSARNNRKKQSVLEQHYSHNEAAPWMIHNGGKNRIFNVREYLYEIPFDQAFDE